MAHSIASIVKGLTEALFAAPSAREIATLCVLTGLASCLALRFVLLKIRRSKVPAVKTEACSEAARQVAMTQVELRELVQGFSCLVEQALRALDQHPALSKPPDAQERVVQLLELGLTATEVARATGLAFGEVALLMNLHRAKGAMGRLAATPPTDAGDVPDRVRDGNGRSSQEEIEVDRT